MDVGRLSSALPLSVLIRTCTVGFPLESNLWAALTDEIILRKVLYVVGLEEEEEIFKLVNLLKVNNYDEVSGIYQVMGKKWQPKSNQTKVHRYGVLT